MCGALSPATYAGVRWLVPRVVPAERLGRANAVIAISDQLPLLLGAALVGPTLALLGPVRSLAVPVLLLGLAVSLALRLPAHRLGAVAPAVADTPRSGRLRLPSKVVALITLSTAYYFVFGPSRRPRPATYAKALSTARPPTGCSGPCSASARSPPCPSGRLLARRRPGLVNALGALAWGLVMLPVLFIDNLTAAAIVFLLGGAIWGPYTAVETCALQRWVDPARHGAVFGLQRALLATATPLGAAFGALALRPGNAHLLLALSAAACALAGAAALAHRGLRTTP